MAEPRSGRVASCGESSGRRVSLERSSLPRSRPWSAAAAHGRWASILTCHTSLICEQNHDPTAYANDAHIRLNQVLSMTLLMFSMAFVIASR